jgi:hypothetical protein
MTNNKNIPAPPTDHIITFEGEAFADCLIMHTTFTVPLWQRIKNLFSPKLIICNEIYTKEIMPRHKARAIATSISYWRIYQGKRWERKGKGKVSFPPTGRK